jgi:hypothetical protein
MGYQVVTVRLKDGRQFAGVTVVGGIISRVAGDESIPFAEEEIDGIVVTHKAKRHEYFALYDYRQGGLWVILWADSAEQIRRKYPALEVFEGRPPMLDDATVSAIRRAGVRDIDSPPDEWLADLAPVVK